MKKLLRVLLMAALLAGYLVILALAAESPVSGLYEVTAESGFSLTPLDVDGEAVIATTQGELTGFYPNAVKVQLTYATTQADAQYLVLALDDGTAIPNEGNLVYIDQTAPESGSVTFTVYPSRLESGKLYNVYLSSNADAGVTALTKAGSFRYYVPYTLGDVNDDGAINTRDAMACFSHFVKKNVLTGNAFLAADITGEGVVNTQDGMRILSYYLKKITEL